MIENLPVALQSGVMSAWEAYLAAGGHPAVLDEAGAAGTLGKVWACSRFVSSSCVRDPHLLPALLAGGLDSPRPVGSLRADFARIAINEDEPGFMRDLRQLRRSEFVRIAWRDLAGWASLDETLTDLSEFADEALAAATRFAGRDLAQRHGVPGRDGVAHDLVVLAMGKLGGAELNFSSDIDLIPLFPGSGETGGRRPLSHEQWFTRQTQKIIDLLSRVTEDGFVFRVDTRLRPFGDSGPLVRPFASFENYLIKHGREWERYAYVKARPVTGLQHHRRDLMDTLRPFVYRRYLDFGVFEALRDMHESISAEVQRQELRDDVKRGPGGIREIEFIVQALQLLRGGREPELRQRSLQPALRRLAERERIARPAAVALRDAYRFLRRLENRIQAVDDAQWHALPEDETGRARLACAMGFTDWPALAGRLDQHRTRVREQFGAIVIGPRRTEASRPGIAEIWSGKLSAEDALAILEKNGMGDARAVLDAVTGLRRSARYGNLSERARARLDLLVPRLLESVAKLDAPAAPLMRVLGIVESVASRSAYLALLNDNPSVLERLVSLCTQSVWIAEELAAHPLLLDELIDPRCFRTPPQRSGWESDLARRFAPIADDDLEQQMDALRQFQRAAMFQVAVSDLSGILPLMKVSDRLTDIAELVLGKVIDLARAQICARHGLPQADARSGRRPGLAIVGYGKLGGIELGYGSDLDLVFLHNAGPGTTDGERPVEAAVFFARLATRVVHFLSTQTRSGVLYEVDTRLRPSGKGGLLVSSLAAFETYQREQAWTWEHQALLRARAVAGDPVVCRDFERVRRSVGASARDPDVLRGEVRDMRRRMRETLSRGGEHYFDIKQDAGGLADIEFLVQYMVLARARDFPAVLAWSDNIRQLEELCGAGLLAAQDGACLADAYRAYRKRIHRLTLGGSAGVVPQGEFRMMRARVSALWRRIIEH